jgi:uncharacterized membrane protein
MQSISTYNGANQKSALGMEGNLAAAIGYPIGIVGLISAIIEKENRFVKFHAWQSVIWSFGFSIVFFIVFFVLGILAAIIGQVSSALGGIFALLISLLVPLYLLILFGALLFAAYKAYQGAVFKLPIAGNLAEKFTK